MQLPSGKVSNLPTLGRGCIKSVVSVYPIEEGVIEGVGQ